MVESIKGEQGADEQLHWPSIGTLGPMLGLVGTVFGMILSFMVLARGGKVEAAKLADGISHALVVTLLGIGHLGARPSSSTRSSATGSRGCRWTSANIADDLLTQMYHNSKKPAVAAPHRPQPRPAPPP